MTKEHPQFSKVCKLVGRGLIDEFMAYGRESLCQKTMHIYFQHCLSSHIGTLAGEVEEQN